MTSSCTSLRRWLFIAALACTVPLSLSTLAVGEGRPARLDAEPLEDLGADLLDDEAAHEDGGAGDMETGQVSAGPNDWLKLVKERMQTAEAILAAHDASGRASTTQREVVSELDALIAKLQKQCEQCGGQCNKPSSPQDKPPKPGGKKGSKPGETSAVAATKATAPPDQAAIGALVKDLWGRLPERQREELLQPLSEEFLPEYASDIEEYFRVLAETPADRATERQP